MTTKPYRVKKLERLMTTQPFDVNDHRCFHWAVVDRNGDLMATTRGHFPNKSAMERLRNILNEAYAEGWDDGYEAHEDGSSHESIYT